MNRLAILLAALAIGALAAISGSDARSAHAADCNGPCLRVDAIPGGPIDASASVAGNFGVDIVAQNGGNTIAAFQFNLRYNTAVIRATTVVPIGPAAAPGWDCALLPPSADQDGNPATGDAFLGCFLSVGGGPIPDGVVARVDFTTVGSGTTALDLTDAVMGNNEGIELVSCDPVITNAGGGCTDASVSTSGTPPPPPGNDNLCTVSFAIDGETVQCVDGRRFRFIGVGSPLGADAGTAWATAVTQWFLAGKTVFIEDDVNKFDQFGQRYGYPVVLGTDGNIYNISALLIYVGMARYIPDAANKRHDGWLAAAQVWARTACWNMWDGGNPWAGESGCT